MNELTLISSALSVLIFVVLYVWTAWSLSAVFVKADLDGWRAWVPVLNLIVVLRLGGFSAWFALLVVVPALGHLALAVVLIMAAHRINRAFGLGAGMTVLAALFPPVWTSMLGWGSARWLGTPAHVAAAGPLRTENPYVTERPGPVEGQRGSAPVKVDAPAPPVLPPSVPPAPGVPLSEREPRLVIVPGATTALPPAPAPITHVPITHVPGTRTSPPASQPAQPAQAPQSVTDQWTSAAPHPAAAPEPSGQADPIGADAPRPARSAVAAQHALAEIPDEDVFDLTVVGTRKRTMWSLVPPQGARILLTADVAILGRRPAFDPAFAGAQLVPVTDDTRTVSKTHARLERRGEDWVVIDLHSTNGVILIDDADEEVDATPGVPERLTERFLLGDAPLRFMREGA